MSILARVNELRHRSLTVLEAFLRKHCRLAAERARIMNAILRRYARLLIARVTPVIRDLTGKHRQLTAGVTLFALAISLQTYVAYSAEVSLSEKRSASVADVERRQAPTTDDKTNTKTTAVNDLSHDEVILMAKVIEGEAADEPYAGKVAVGAVIVNRMEDERFPKTLKGVVYEPLAFEAVANGQIRRPLKQSSIHAAEEALKGYDPTDGAVFYWNPYKRVNNWVWSRPIVTQIGDHVFAH